MLGGPPPFRWERTLLFGGVFLAILDWPARCGRARSDPCPFLPAHSLCALQGLGGALIGLSVLGPVSPGGPVIVWSVVPPPVPPL